MKTFYIVTNAAGDILSEDLEFASKLEAIEWARSQEFEERIFLYEVNEII